MNTEEDKDNSFPAQTASAISACAFLVPLALSYSSSPSRRHPRTLFWYSLIRKPKFKPPDWSIPLAWTGIEACLAVASFRLLRLPPSFARTKAIAWWSWNVFMIGGWSKFFFHNRNLPLSTIAAASMIASSAAFVKEAEKVDKPAARLGTPLVMWVTFATLLTGTIWALNKKRR